MTEQLRTEPPTRPAVHSRIGATTGARLSAASAASVRDAAIAVISHGVRYLPVVEDGTLVGVVALAPAPRGKASVIPGAHGGPSSDSDAHG
jgi:hypothetical protein